MYFKNSKIQMYKKYRPKFIGQLYEKIKKPFYVHKDIKNALAPVWNDYLKFTSSETQQKCVCETEKFEFVGKLEDSDDEINYPPTFPSFDFIHSKTPFSFICERYYPVQFHPIFIDKIYEVKLIKCPIFKKRHRWSVIGKLKNGIYFVWNNQSKWHSHQARNRRGSRCGIIGSYNVDFLHTVSEPTTIIHYFNEVKAEIIKSCNLHLDVINIVCQFITFYKSKFDREAENSDDALNLSVQHTIEKRFIESESSDWCNSDDFKSDTSIEQQYDNYYFVLPF